MIVLLSILLTTALGLAQQSVPPPPKPASDGPSLEATMKFIQEKIEQQGKLNYAAHVHDSQDGSNWVVPFSTLQTNIVANPTLCRISYHERRTRRDEVTADDDYWFALKAVQEMVVMSREQGLKRADTNAGHPTWDSKVDPPIWLIEARYKGGQNIFYFHEEEIANRVAKALVHAVELCGGGKTQEPF
jgi:hypothetical protein